MLRGSILDFGFARGSASLSLFRMCSRESQHRAAGNTVHTSYGLSNTVPTSYRLSNTVPTSYGFRRTKSPGRDVDHSPPSRPQVKNEWSHISSPPTLLHGVYSDNFTSYCLIMSVTVSATMTCVTYTYLLGQRSLDVRCLTRCLQCQ